MLFRSQPTGQSCAVANGTGTVTSADVSNIAITCTSNSYSLGGTISGLSSSGLVLANGTVSSTCGGTVTDASGAALTAGSSSVKLTGGAFSAGTSRCTLTVNVTASAAGAYVNGNSNISGVSVLANQVTDQTLSVVQGAPIVRLNQPGTINSSNATAYPVAGTCQDSNGTVTIHVGSLTSTTPCSSASSTAPSCASWWQHGPAAAGVVPQGCASCSSG